MIPYFLAREAVPTGTAVQDCYRSSQLISDGSQGPLGRREFMRDTLNIVKYPWLGRSWDTGENSSFMFGWCTYCQITF